MGRPLKHPAAYVCNRCGYIESYVPLKDRAGRVLSEEETMARHCGISMRLVSAAELRKIDREMDR